LHLIIDIGNTQTKFAVFSGRDLLHVEIAKGFSENVFQKLNKWFNPSHIIISSVVNYNKSFLSELKNEIVVLTLNHQTKIPVTNLYATPKTLGNDRLANAIAIAQRNPKKNNLVIDAGTCLKFDFVNSRNQYLGGAISPGMQMRFAALHHFTDKLPVIKPSEKLPELIGNTTQNSILSGVQQGMLAEIKEIISVYKKKHSNLHVYLTGGDASYFAKHLKKAIFAPALTLYGLNEILHYNTH
jgi:type III pantothenate kinase